MEETHHHAHIVDSDHEHDHNHEHCHDHSHDHEHTDRVYERHITPADCTDITEDMEVFLCLLLMKLFRSIRL